MKQSGSRETLNRIARTGDPVWKHDSSRFFECLDPDTRVQLIGCNLSKRSDWLKTHPHEARWLAEQGISAAEAVRRFRQVTGKKVNWKIVGGIGGIGNRPKKGQRGNRNRRSSLP